MKKLELTESVIRKLEEKLSNKEIEAELKKYEQQGFDNDQMEEIRYGLKEGLDVSKYADIRFYGFQMEQMRLGLEKGLDISKYADPKFESDQMERIRLGLEEGLDVSKYANPEFDILQMGEIRKGLEEGLDVSKYADPKFDWCQMKQIRKGLEEGLDVSKYADPANSWEHMKQIRLDLEKLLDNKEDNKEDNKDSGSIEGKLEERLDTDAKNSKYWIEAFLDDYNQEDYEEAKTNWEKLSFEEKYKEAESYYENKDEFYIMLFNGINGVNIVTDVEYDDNAGIQLYEYGVNEKSHLNQIKIALKGKIDGKIYNVASDEEYDSVCMTPTINNVKNYKAIKKIVDSIVK